MLYMLDTNTASAAIKGSAALDRHLGQIPLRQWCLSAITRAELRYGLALRPDATRLARLVNEFLAMAHTLDWNKAATDAHGYLRAQLRQRGTPIGAFDEMIAAHALATGAVLVTDNVKHFSQVDGLVVENWMRPPRR